MIDPRRARDQGRDPRRREGCRQARPHARPRVRVARLRARRPIDRDRGHDRRGDQEAQAIECERQRHAGQYEEGRGEERPEGHPEPPAVS